MGEMIKLPIFLLLWTIMLAIKFVTAFLGLFVIAYMYRFRRIDFKDMPAWTTPWLNPEDWHGTVHHYLNSLPRWWVESRGANLWSFYKYHALRNPANGLRNFEWLDLDIVPEKVRFIRSKNYVTKYEPDVLRKFVYRTGWYLAWQGFRAGFKIVHIWNEKRHLVIKIGWRVEPLDIKDRDRAQVLIDNAGFATKVLLYNKG